MDAGRTMLVNAWQSKKAPNEIAVILEGMFTVFKSVQNMKR
jgi:hypothetical protein